MLEALFGSKTRERVLLYLLTHGDAYAREMAREYGCTLNVIQRQLAAFEEGGVVYSRLRGRTRLYQLNPRYPFRKELERLLWRALEFYPSDERERLYTPRLRPRRAGKPVRYVEGR
jgi:predicted ArsR family transcriptional regulator